MWIGYWRADASAAEWTWEGGDVSIYTNWAPEEPEDFITVPG